MRGSVVVVIASLLASIGGIRCAGAQPRVVFVEDARQALAAIADTIPTFDAYDYIWNRGHRPDGWSRLVESNYDSDTLEVLLNDTRSRVRTLAMALLFSKEDPRLLTSIAFLLPGAAGADNTFPVLLPTDNNDPRATAPQTVGMIARQMLGTYMLAAGMSEGRDPRLEDWISYDSRHRNRPYSLSVLAVRLCRITGMQSPFPADRRPLLLRFRYELDKLPAEDRDLYLLWLCHGDNPHFDGGELLATEPELIDAAKQLGRQKLLQIIDGRPPGTDPDLPATQWWQSQERYRSVVSFILAHADQLLTPADEPFLAAIEQGERDKIARGAREDLEIVSVEALRRACAMLAGTAH
jgi:hypothetical protein